MSCGQPESSGPGPCAPASRLKANNLVLTIMAKEYNPDITVIARAHSKSFAQRLRRAAGADNVILAGSSGRDKRVALEILGRRDGEAGSFPGASGTSKILLEEVRLNLQVSVGWTNFGRIENS